MSDLEKRERLWCVACGTVTRTRVCDCNRYGGREPNFVNYVDELQKQLATVLKQLVSGLPERATLAETIHNARWPLDRQMEITPFADEDRNGREYCLRIADAVLRLLTSAEGTEK